MVLACRYWCPGPFDGLASHAPCRTPSHHQRSEPRTALAGKLTESDNTSLVPGAPLWLGGQPRRSQKKGFNVGSYCIGIHYLFAFFFWGGEGGGRPFRQEEALAERTFSPFAESLGFGKISRNLCGNMASWRPKESKGRSASGNLHR